MVSVTDCKISVVNYGALVKKVSEASRYYSGRGPGSLYVTLKI